MTTSETRDEANSDPLRQGPPHRASQTRKNGNRRVVRQRRIVRGVLDSALSSSIAWMAGFYIWLLFRTTRWRYEGREHLDAMFAEPGFIAAVWHSRLAPIAMLRPKDRRAVALISANRDGAMLARIMNVMGAEAVHGSSQDPRKKDRNRGGAAAAARCVDAVKQGAILVITPDGPRGPRMRAKPGVAALAAMTGRFVLPVAYSVKRAKILNSWDRFMIPWPFNSGVFVFGRPIAPPDASDDAAVERHRLAVEAAMIDATRRADTLLGRETPEPGAALPSGVGA